MLLTSIDSIQEDSLFSNSTYRTSVKLEDSMEPDSEPEQQRNQQKNNPQQQTSQKRSANISTDTSFPPGQTTSSHGYSFDYGVEQYGQPNQATPNQTAFTPMSLSTPNPMGRAFSFSSSGLAGFPSPRNVPPQPPLLTTKQTRKSIYDAQSFLGYHRNNPVPNFTGFPNTPQNQHTSFQQQMHNLQQLQSLGGYQYGETMFQGLSMREQEDLNKRGTSISAEDRKPPTEEELVFYRNHINILHSLIVYNVQYLTFFPQKDWLNIFNQIVNSLPRTLNQTHFSHMTEIKQEQAEADSLLPPYLARPSHLSLPLSVKTSESEAKETQRTKYVRETIEGRLPQKIVEGIKSLTQFQKTLSRNKCREVLGFYKLVLDNRNQSRLSTAQQLEASSTYVVRTILNWAREYQVNGGLFNKSRIGKHKRVTLLSDPAFQEALIAYSRRVKEETGDEISVDKASQWIKEYHAKQVELAGANGDGELPGPPSSRATVHRWLKILNIQLGSRGKKKSHR
eukprot:augustus_masked-scaffold_83-processed-gene-0.2-mRNA-1 protein AED:0.07 eAED:0.07 QI:233/1/1/1/0/0.5/2/156/507